MDKDSIYWIWLQCCLGTDSKRLKSAIGIFGTPENIFNSDERDLRLGGIFTEKEIQKLTNKDMSYPEKAAEKCDKMGYSVIHYNHESYPGRLRRISSPPIVLYVSGQLPEDKLCHIGIVGTRNPDESGKSLSYSFGYDLAGNNNVVISGGALGIDIYAHKGAIESGGKTVCVLGCGIDMYESSVAKYLTKSIIDHGAVISEYPPGYPPRSYTFPIRNRIISGMSDCILTVQAGIGSGALITVKYALEQNRKIFSVPGSMNNIFSSGTNYMLKCGFSAALCAGDIIKWYSSERNETVNPVLSEKQIEFLSMKASDINNYTKRDASSMPASGCYEIASSIYNSKEEGSDDEPELTSDSKIVVNYDEKTKYDNFTDEEKEQILKNTDTSNVYTLEPDDLDRLFNVMSEKVIRRKLTVSEADTDIKKEMKTKNAQNAPKYDVKISNNVKKDENKKEIITEQLTEDTLTVYHTISDTPVFIDSIAQATGLSAGIILSSLTELELFGLIETLPGKKYVRK